MATERKSDPLRPPTGAAIVLTVLVPFGCGFYLSYLFRTVNGVISPHLRSEFGLDAEGLGFLTGIYFATFAAMQPVLGLVLDRYGPRRVQAALLVVAAIGAGVFAVGQDVVMLAVGRGLIGVGVSACLMAALKATAMWWPKERLPLVNNLIGAFGSFGALSATTPLHALLGVFGWREVFAGLAVVTLALAIVVLAVVPERRDALDATSPVGAQLAELLAVCRSAFFWRIGGVFVMCQATLLAYQTLWAAPWLGDVNGLGEAAVADHLFLIQLGFFLGLLAGGGIADRARARGVTTTAVFAVGIGVFLVVQLVLVAGDGGHAAILWAGFGFFGATAFLAFTIYVEHYPAALAGRVLTAANLLLFVAAFALQWGIGALLETFPMTPAGGHAAIGHTTALGVALALQAAAFVWLAWPRRGGG